MTRADLFKSSGQFLLVAAVAVAIMLTLSGGIFPGLGARPEWVVAVGSFVLAILSGMGLLGALYLFARACFRSSSYDPRAVWLQDHSLPERDRSLNAFQRDTEQKLRESLVSVRSSLEAYEIDGVNEDYIVARLQGTDLRVLIYEDGAEILSDSEGPLPRVDDQFERADYKTLEDLSAAFVAQATRRATEREVDPSRSGADSGPIL